MCAMRGSASRVGACGKSNNVVMLLPPSKLARKFLPGLLAPTPVPRIPNARALFRLRIRDTYTLFRSNEASRSTRERGRRKKLAKYFALEEKSTMNRERSFESLACKTHYVTT